MARRKGRHGTPVLMDGERLFENQMAAVRWLEANECQKVNRSNISQCVNGYTRSYHGHTFELHDPEKKAMERRIAELERMVRELGGEA